MKYKPSYHNRLGTEIKRFGKHVLGGAGTQLDFIHALEPLPTEQARIPYAGIRELYKLPKNHNKLEAGLDLELAFMAIFGCRPNEAAKIFDKRRSKWENVHGKRLAELWSQLASPIQTHTQG